MLGNHSNKWSTTGPERNLRGEGEEAGELEANFGLAPGGKVVAQGTAWSSLLAVRVYPIITWRGGSLMTRRRRELWTRQRVGNTEAFLLCLGSLAYYTQYLPRDDIVPATVLLTLPGNLVTAKVLAAAFYAVDSRSVEVDFTTPRKHTGPLTMETLPPGCPLL